MTTFIHEKLKTRSKEFAGKRFHPRMSMEQLVRELNVIDHDLKTVRREVDSSKR